jgi:hypothetical protein
MPYVPKIESRRDRPIPDGADAEAYDETQVAPSCTRVYACFYILGARSILYFNQ